ncbi:hypothetical protein VUR80DRAFT_3268 [Thermomyces stellatus]
MVSQVKAVTVRHPLEPPCVALEGHTNPLKCPTALPVTQWRWGETEPRGSLGQEPETGATFARLMDSRHPRLSVALVRSPSTLLPCLDRRRWCGFRGGFACGMASPPTLLVRDRPLIVP